MLYQFLLNFVDTFGFLNVFKYITFRTGLSLFTSLTIVLLIGGPFISFFSNRKIVNPIRDDGPQDHIVKKNWHPNNGWSDHLIWVTVFCFVLGRSIKYKCFILYLYSHIIWFTWGIR